MGMIKTLPFAILFVLASSFAIADGEQLYIGIGAYETSIDGDFDNIDIDDDDTTAAAFLGYKFSKMFAIEAGYYDLGDHSGNNIDAEVDAFSLAGALILPLAIFDIYAKAGIAYINIDWKNKINNRSDDDSDSEAFAGVGANINLGRHIDLYAEYLYFDTDIDVDTLGLGVRLLF